MRARHYIRISSQITLTNFGRILIENGFDRVHECFGGGRGNKVHRPVPTLCTTTYFHFLHLYVILILPLFTLFTLSMRSTTPITFCC